MDNFINSTLVDYDIYASKVSEIINRLFYTEYLLTSLSARADISNYEGFKVMFDHFKEDISFEKEIIIDDLISKERPIAFEKIDGIEIRGNKISDLIKIYKECIEKNVLVCQEVEEFISKDVSAKMAFISNIFLLREFFETHKIAVNKISKMLDKAVNNYAAILTIDRILCDKYKKGCLK